MSKLIQLKPSENLEFKPDSVHPKVRQAQYNCFAYVLNEPRVGFQFWKAFLSPANESYSNLYRQWKEGMRRKDNLQTYYSLSESFKSAVEADIIADAVAGIDEICEEEAESGYLRGEHIFAYLPMHKHFYRKDFNGIWSHKKGWDFIRNVDDRGNLIHCLADAQLSVTYTPDDCAPVFRPRDIDKTKEEGEALRYYRLNEEGVYLQLAF